MFQIFHVQTATDLLGGLTHEHETLRVRDDLGSVESLLKVINELLPVTLEGLPLGTSNDLGSPYTFLLDGRQATGKYGLTNERDCAVRRNCE